MNIKSSIHKLALALLLLVELGQIKVYADVVIGFEDYSTTHTIVSSSSGNPVITTIVGQTDPATGTNWSSTFNSTTTGAAQLTVSTVKPKTGVNSLLISDNDASSGKSFCANLNLASKLPTTNAYTVQFSLAVDYSTLGGNGAFIMLGSGNFTLGSTTDKYWMALNIDNTGKIGIWGDNSTGTTAVTTKLADYSTYASNGSYLTFSLTLDPMQNLYTNIVLSGDNGTSTNLVMTAGTLGTGLASSNMGSRLPTLSNVAGTIGSTVDFGTSGTSLGDLYIDDFSVTTVPEPSTLAFVVFGSAVLLVVRRARMQE